MGFYDLSKQERTALVDLIKSAIEKGFITNNKQKCVDYFSDEDTYVRKAAYLAVGKIFYTHPNLQISILQMLKILLKSEDEKIRQTVINAAGEIGKFHFYKVQSFFDTGLFDQHHSVRNAVIGSIKKMGEINPEQVLPWVKPYLKHEDKEIRREICHGLELRGRKYPQDVLPLLKELEHDETRRVSDTLIHVIGQIAYKKGCLPTVITELKTWSNKELVRKALDEIVDVHLRYKKFAALSQQEAIDYIDKHFG